MGKEPSIDEILASLNELLGNQIGNQDVADDESVESKRVKAKALLEDLRHADLEGGPAHAEDDAAAETEKPVEKSEAPAPSTSATSTPALQETPPENASSEAPVYSPVQPEDDERMLLTREMLLETSQVALPFRRLGDKTARKDDAAPAQKQPESTAPESSVERAKPVEQAKPVAAAQQAPAAMSEEELEQLIDELSGVIVARLSQQVPELVREVILQYLPSDLVGKPPSDSPSDKK